MLPPMRWAALVTGCLLWSCAPSEEAWAPGVLRQAGTLPVESGTANSKLGASLAGCRVSGFVAGAPGTGTAWRSDLGPGFGLALPQGNYLGRAVACEGTATIRVLAGGTQGVREEVSGSWNTLSAEGVLSLSTGHDPSLPVLVGQGDSVRFHEPTTFTLLGRLDGGAPFGTVVQWFPAQATFALTQGGRVNIYDYDTIARTASLISFVPNSTNQLGFGKSLAVGNFSPAGGIEIAIGAEGKVNVFNLGSGTFLAQLLGTNGSFGSSLAVIRDGVAPGLDALLVGEPASNAVYRYVGNARSVFNRSAVTGANYGASIAVDGTRMQVAVGAPDYQGTGAVFLEPLIPSAMLGEVMTCAAGMTCISSDCQSGLCVGDVFCNTEAATPACSPNQFCNGMGGCLNSDGGLIDGGLLTLDGGVVSSNDAGTPDGGPIASDAGTSEDAGTLDAGTLDAGMLDAGTRDAGIRDAGTREDAGARGDAGTGDAGIDGEAMTPLIFSTTGCSETGALPLLMLGLAFARRRRGP